jgi:hypothetical protein
MAWIDMQSNANASLLARLLPTKRYRWIVLSFSLCALLALGLLTQRRSTRILFSEEQATLIKLGMTEQEIIGLLGAAPADYATRAHHAWSGKVLVGIGPVHGYFREDWISDDGCISVFFSKGKRPQLAVWKMLWRLPLTPTTAEIWLKWVRSKVGV